MLRLMSYFDIIVTNQYIMVEQIIGKYI